MGPVIEAFGTNLRSYRLEAGSDIRGGTSRLDSGEWEDAGIVLTTYETMRDYHMSFASIPFDAIVYDEIQKLKNPANQMTRAAKEPKRAEERRGGKECGKPRRCRWG